MRMAALLKYDSLHYCNKLLRLLILPATTYWEYVLHSEYRACHSTLIKKVNFEIYIADRLLTPKISSFILSIIDEVKG